MPTFEPRRNRRRLHHAATRVIPSAEACADPHVPSLHPSLHRATNRRRNNHPFNRTGHHDLLSSIPSSERLQESIRLCQTTPTVPFAGTFLPSFRSPSHRNLHRTLGSPSHRHRNIHRFKCNNNKLVTSSACPHFSVLWFIRRGGCIFIAAFVADDNQCKLHSAFGSYTLDLLAEIIIDFL